MGNGQNRDALLGKANGRLIDVVLGTQRVKELPFLVARARTLPRPVSASTSSAL